MRLHRSILILFLVAATLCQAQQPSPWQGEWGHFNDLFPGSGARLTVSSCTEQSCKFFLTVAQSSMVACSSPEDTATLTLLSSTDATVTIPGEDKTKSCTLHLQRTPTPPSITVVSSGNDCAYYCTSNATFNSTLPLRSTTLFNTQHLDACFSHASPATLATCNDPTLGALEQTWSALYADFPLQGHPSEDENGYTYAQTVDASILKQCDTASSPADCLRTRFTSDIAAMQAKKTATEDASTERGDPATGGALAKNIAGRYRHIFANGDVQGDHYRSTNTLTITPVGKSSISFDAELNFFNGHTCSLSGGALYRKDGSFVFDDEPSNALPPEPACRLAIIPSSDGVSFKDLNGSCKNYCGMRGSWDGEAFSFNDRVGKPAATSTNKPTQK